DPRRGRRNAAEIDRRVRRPGEHRRGPAERRPHAQPGRVGRAGPDAGVRRIYARARRHRAGRTPRRRPGGAGGPSGVDESRRMGAVRHAGRDGVHFRLPAGVLAGDGSPGLAILTSPAHHFVTLYAVGYMPNGWLVTPFWVEPLNTGGGGTMVT